MTTFNSLEVISPGQRSSYLVLLVKCHDQIVERCKLTLFITEKDISDVMIRPKIVIQPYFSVGKFIQSYMNLILDIM